MFKHVVIGGTFDHFHQGHKALINKAFKIGERVTIGLAGEKLIKNKLLFQTIENYSARLKALKDYLSLIKSGDRYQILKIDDIFGTTLTDKTIEAIVVSQKTFDNARLINRERIKRDLPPLEIIIIDDVLAYDDKLITSERIRLGVINREGDSYQLAVFGEGRRRLILPDYLRESLRQPLGKVFRGSEKQLQLVAQKVAQLFKQLNSVMMVAVGDIVSFSLESIGFFPDVKIIDLRTRRRNIKDGSPEILPQLNSSPPNRRGLKHPVSENFGSPSFLKAVNPPGTLSSKVGRVFQRAVAARLTTGQKQTILIEGEEDLTALLAILLAPLRCLVVYGQMDLGVVAVEVSEEKKKEVKEILKKFI